MYINYQEQLYLIANVHFLILQLHFIPKSHMKNSKLVQYTYQTNPIDGELSYLEIIIRFDMNVNIAV